MERWKLTVTNIFHSAYSLALRDVEKFYKLCQGGLRIKTLKKMVKKFLITTKSNWQKNLQENQLRVVKCLADHKLNNLINLVVALTKKLLLVVQLQNHSLLVEPEMSKPSNRRSYNSMKVMIHCYGIQVQWLYNT